MFPTNHSDIAANFASHLGADVAGALTSWRIASQGMSDETIFVTITCPEAHELVIRRFRPDGIAQELKDIGRQFKLLDALRGKGIPIPEVLWYEPTSSLLGAPFFVMRRVAGHVPVPWAPEGRIFLREAGDGAIGQQFVDILARIHALPWRGLGVDFLPGASEIPHFAAREIERLTASVRRYRTEPEPVFEDALGWLAAHAPKVEYATLVHGDYRTGNMIYDEGRIAAVLDWEFAAVGDPMLDLAWVCARSNRMESDRVCYLLPREVFLERYEKASGRMPDEPRIRFWELFHQVRNGMAWISVADAWKTGRTKDLRLARWSMTLPTMRRLILELLEEVA